MTAAAHTGCLHCPPYLGSSRCFPRATRRPATPIRPCGVSGARKCSRDPCAVQGGGVTSSQVIASTTLPGNISPPEPTFSQASRSCRLCSILEADWIVARRNQLVQVAYLTDGGP